MGLFIDAIKEIAHLDLLFYVPSCTDVSASAVAELERALSKHWNAEVSLFLCPRFQPQAQLSKWEYRWQHYVLTAFSFLRHGVNGFTRGPRQVRAFEACLQRNPDAVFAHRLAGMCPALLTREVLPPLFLDLDDVEHIVLMRRINSETNLVRRLLGYVSLPALVLGERKAIRRAYRTFVCSESDRRYLAGPLRLPGVVTVPNAVNIPDFQPISPRPTFLFLGQYLYRPNVIAAEYLIEQVWPHVHRSMPEACLIVAGTPPDRIRGYRDNVPGVEFTGYVDDLNDLYRRVRVVCAPLFAGVSGTQTKLIEAAAYGKPIVANRLGAEGVELRDGCELLVRDTPQAFATACIQLANDSALCQQLGSAARAKAVELYNRPNIVRLIQKLMTAGNLTLHPILAEDNLSASLSSTIPSAGAAEKN